MAGVRKSGFVNKGFYPDPTGWDVAIYDIIYDVLTRAAECDGM